MPTIIKRKIVNIVWKILLFYSTFLSTVLIIGGIYTARVGKEIVSNILFLPIVITLWVVLIQSIIRRRKERKKKRR